LVGGRLGLLLLLLVPFHIDGLEIELLPMHAHCKYTTSAPTTNNTTHQLQFFWHLKGCVVGDLWPNHLSQTHITPIKEQKYRSQNQQSVIDGQNFRRQEDD
jgi:hypothetical protein